MRFSDRKTNPAPVCKQIDNYIFSFTDFLGEGGFSKVYKGTHSISSIFSINIRRTGGHQNHPTQYSKI